MRSYLRMKKKVSEKEFDVCAVNEVDYPDVCVVRKEDRLEQGW